MAEAFLVAWRRFDELPGRHEDARAWVFGIARHTMLNERMGLRRREALEVRLADPMPTQPVAGTAGSEVVEVVYRSDSHGDIAATVSGGHFALWWPGDELLDVGSKGIQVEVTYRDGSTRAARLEL